MIAPIGHQPSRVARWIALAIVFAGASHLYAQPSDNGDATTTSPKPAVARSGPVRVEVIPPSAPIVAGDPFDIILRIETVQGVQVAPPQPSDILGVFEVVEVKRNDTDCPPPAACLELAITLVAHFPGDYAVPSMPIPFYDDRNIPGSAQDAIAQQLNTPALPLQVEEGLADVRGPVSMAIPIEWRIVGYVALGIVGFLLLGLLAWRYWPAKKEAVAPPAPPPLPAYEWALREFRRLDNDHLIAVGRIKDYYFGVNAILRGYIEREFGFNAGEQTSEEFVRSLQHDPRFSETQRELLRAFIDACDPVKYAAQIPSEDEISWVQKTAREFVERTHEAREAERRAAEQRALAEGAATNDRREVHA